MEYKEWSELKQIEDKENPFCSLFEYPDGSRFYIEPAFYTQLMGLKSLKPLEFDLVLMQMEKVVKENKKVVFTMDFEMPATHRDDYIYQELTDITDVLGIFVEDKSRGSDYGD